jgi:predicted NUDIX family NTP pyrophosphohydrolase
MAQLSAGLLMFRFVNNSPQFFLIHPGGPFFTRKDEGVWSIPKGLCDPGEELLEAAKREFTEETGIVPSGKFVGLNPIKMKSGKVVHAWMFRGEWEESAGISSNTFRMEWPPKSGKSIDVPEADRGVWFALSMALQKINPQQRPFLTQAAEILGNSAL